MNPEDEEKSIQFSDGSKDDCLTDEEIQILTEKTNELVDLVNTLSFDNCQGIASKSHQILYKDAIENIVSIKSISIVCKKYIDNGLYVSAVNCYDDLINYVSENLVMTEEDIYEKIMDNILEVKKVVR